MASVPGAGRPRGAAGGSTPAAGRGPHGVPRAVPAPRSPPRSPSGGRAPGWQGQQPPSWSPSPCSHPCVRSGLYGAPHSLPAGLNPPAPQNLKARRPQGWPGTSDGVQAPPLAQPGVGGRCMAAETRAGRGVCVGTPAALAGGVWGTGGDSSGSGDGAVAREPKATVGCREWAAGCGEEGSGRAGAGSEALLAGKMAPGRGQPGFWHCKVPVPRPSRTKPSRELSYRAARWRCGPVLSGRFPRGRDRRGAGTAPGPSRCALPLGQRAGGTGHRDTPTLRSSRPLHPKSGLCPPSQSCTPEGREM